MKGEERKYGERNLKSEGDQKNEEVAINEQKQEVKRRKRIEGEQSDRWQRCEGCFVGSLASDYSAELFFWNYIAFIKISLILHLLDSVRFIRENRSYA